MKGRGEGRRTEREAGREKEKQRNRGGKGRMSGRRERDRSCLFGKEMERKELRLEAEGRSACLSGLGREWVELVC